jgi:iron complex outermembrane receptor protein
VAKDTLCAAVSTLLPGSPDQLAACGATSIQRLPRLETLALSGYGQFTYDILQNLHFTAGLRYSTEAKTFSARQQNFIDPVNTVDALPGDGANPVGGGRTTSERFGKFTPLLSLSFDVSENGTMYATYSKGFKSGGFNGRPNANVPSSLLPFDQEVLNNYEVGYKGGFFDRRLVTSVSLFYGLYDDIQQTLLLASPNGDFASRVANAGEAVIRGAEIELRALPIPALDLRMGFGFTDAEYREFEDVRTIGGVLTPVSRRDEVFFNTPTFTGTFSAAYTFYDLGPLGDMTARLNWYHQNEVNYGPQSDTLEQGTYGLLSGQLSFALPDGKTELAIFGENLLNRRYVNSGINFEDGFAASFAFFGPPRMYGLEIRRSF